MLPTCFCYPQPQVPHFLNAFRNSNQLYKQKTQMFIPTSNASPMGALHPRFTSSNAWTIYVLNY